MRTAGQILAEFVSGAVEGGEREDDPDLPPHLIRVSDGSGRNYIAKLHRTPEKYRREHHAYTTWTTVLGDQTPRLVAADDDRRALLLTALAGSPAASIAPGTRTERVIHRSAGEVLRRLHDSQPAALDPHIGPDLAGRLHRGIERAGGLLSTDERRTVRQHAHALEASGPLEVTVCHLDYQPRNWIVQDGIVRLLDFEHTRVDVRVRDFTRLYYRHWAHSPELREAFFAGYRRELTSSENDILLHCGAIEAVTSLVRAHATGDTDLATHGRILLSQLD